jgi:zinc protease
MGHLGDRRQNPDYAALQVMNKILSGGFSGRLFRTIRSKKGYAYSVFGQFGCEHYYPGMFFVGLKTKTAQTAKAIREVESVLRRLKRKGVSQRELDQAKDQFFNSLVFRFDKPEEILGRRMEYEYRHMPADSFDRLIEEIRKVTAEDVQRAAREYIDMDRIEVLVVGEGDALQPQLRKLGPVQRVDISIPQ